VKLIVVLEQIKMTLDYRSIVDVSGKDNVVYKRVSCTACNGDKRTLFEKVCRSCDGTGYMQEAILVHESAKRTD